MKRKLPEKAQKNYKQLLKELMNYEQELVLIFANF